MLCYILAQYALFIYKNILLFFDIKKQSHLNCCRILNINLVIGICKSNSNKLQMLPTLTRHLQIQFQQVADASDPRICICKFISNKLQMLPNLTRHLQIQFQQVADASDPDQASVAPKTTNQRCPPVNFLLKFAGGHLYCISISSNSYICLFLIHRGLSRPASWHLYGTFPFFHKFPYVLLWKSLPTRQLLLLSVPDGFCPR